jgi:CheY-like chemotaxis protein/putative methionine-R-sulfoxide reductase with GAF domain
VSERPRILVLGSPDARAADLFERCRRDCDVVRVDSLAQGLALLRQQPFDGFLLNPSESPLASIPGEFFQTERILQALNDGIALVGPDFRITWANTTFEGWCGGPVVGRSFYEALGCPQDRGPEYCPFQAALAGKAFATRIPGRDNHTFELNVTPVQETPGRTITQLICLGRDVTTEVQRQQKLDAIHKAGRELAALSADQLNEMSIEERVELLKLNIRHFTHDLLHYDVIEIRLLDRETDKLEPLLEEGMTPEAAHRVLYARATGNGVTGFVAATGKSYLCPDTAADPLYLEGARGAHSSLTVPLTHAEQVIGTFNIESPSLNAFTPEDQQFAEIFSREIATAIHTLELLSAEKRSTASQSIDAISREVALPVDDILAAATAVLDRYIGHDPEMADKLRKILAGARSIKQAIQKVGEDLAPAKAPSKQGEPEHPRLKGMRVLVADNDERVRRSAHSILGRWGCVVETARDGQEALTMARLSTYDAILADIRLPDVSGYEVYRRLREAQPRARVILMTAYGYDASHSIVKARQEGLRFILYKPFRVDQLFAALEASEPSPGPNQPEPVRA